MGIIKYIKSLFTSKPKSEEVIRPKARRIHEVTYDKDIEFIVEKDKDLVKVTAKDGVYIRESIWLNGPYKDLPKSSIERAKKTLQNRVLQRL